MGEQFQSLHNTCKQCTGEQLKKNIQCTGYTVYSTWRWRQCLPPGWGLWEGVWSHSLALHALSGPGQHTLYSKHCTLHTVHYTMYTKHCILETV